MNEYHLLFHINFLALGTIANVFVKPQVLGTIVPLRGKLNGNILQRSKLVKGFMTEMISIMILCGTFEIDAYLTTFLENIHSMIVTFSSLPPNLLPNFLWTVCEIRYTYIGQGFLDP